MVPGADGMAIIHFMGTVAGAHLNPAVRSPSPCAAISRGSGSPATSSSNSPGGTPPPCSSGPFPQRRRTSGFGSHSPRRPGYLRRAKPFWMKAVAPRSGSGQRHSPAPPQAPEPSGHHRPPSRSAATSPWPACGPPDLRRFHEPRPLLRPRPRPVRSLHVLLGLPHGPARRRCARRRHGVRAARTRRRLVVIGRGPGRALHRGRDPRGPACEPTCLIPQQTETSPHA